MSKVFKINHSWSYLDICLWIGYDSRGSFLLLLLHPIKPCVLKHVLSLDCLEYENTGRLLSKTLMLAALSIVLIEPLTKRDVQYNNIIQEEQHGH